MAACLLRAASYLLPSLLGKRMFLIFFCSSGDSLLLVMCLILSGPLSLFFFISWEDLSLLPFLLLQQLGLNPRKARSPVYCPAYTECIISLGSFLLLSDFGMGFCCPFPFLSQEDVFSSVFMGLDLRVKISINIKIKTQ